jgi:hypothetical protein
MNHPLKLHTVTDRQPIRSDSISPPACVIVFALGGQTDGTGGADHLGCDFQTGAAIEVCAAFGNSARVSALFEAELSECSMGGNLCGVSTGEALSRWCAAVVGGNALSDFATAPRWAQDGMPNFVSGRISADSTIAQVESHILAATRKLRQVMITACTRRENTGI